MITGGDQVLSFVGTACCVPCERAPYPTAQRGPEPFLHRTMIVKEPNSVFRVPDWPVLAGPCRVAEEAVRILLSGWSATALGELLKFCDPPDIERHLLRRDDLLALKELLESLHGGD